MVRRSIVILLAVTTATVLCGCAKKAPDSSAPSTGTTSQTDPNPHWVVQQTPSAKVALVYVHGIFGDMTGTWTADNGETFYGLVNENPATKGKVDEFVYGFPSYILKATSLATRAPPHPPPPPPDSPPPPHH